LIVWFGCWLRFAFDLRIFFLACIRNCCVTSPGQNRICLDSVRSRSPNAFGMSKIVGFRILFSFLTKR
jgi:hypothetical protein